MAKKRVVLLLLGIMLGMSALPGQVAFAAEFSDAGTEIVSEVEESSAEDKGLGDGETSLDQEIETETTETQEEFSSEAGENTGQEPEEVDSSLDEPEDGSVVDVEPAEEESQFDDGVLSVEEEDETIATDELEGSQYLNTWHWDPITGAFSY